jgi:hypothetical protein
VGNAFREKAREVVAGGYHVGELFIVLQMRSSVLLKLAVFVTVLGPVVLRLGRLRSKYAQDYLFIRILI